MAHEIETMFSARETPWHGLGTITKEALTSEEALRVAQLDWEVHPQPAYVKINGEEHLIPGALANVRTGDNKVMGIVRGRYKVIQNKEAFAFTDALLGEGVMYETAGALTNGRTWMLAKMPAIEIVGDKVEPYLAFTNSFDGQQAVRVICTPVRVVCQNTLNLALDTARRSWSAQHSNTFDSKIKEARHTLKLATRYYADLTQFAEKMAASKFPQGAFEAFVEELFPLPSVEVQSRANDNVISLRNELSVRYFQAPDLSALRGTRWGVIQAVTDFATHTQPRRLTSSYKDSALQKVFDGNEIVNRAMALLAA